MRTCVGVAAGVGTVAVLAAGLVLSSIQTIHCGVGAPEYQLERVWQKVVIFKVKKKRLPENLEEVFAPEPAPTDRWGHPIMWVTPGPQGAPFALVSLGADGLPGGDPSTDDRDAWWPRPNNPRDPVSRDPSSEGQRAVVSPP